MSNIPQGFQKTEVGVIPTDWEVKKLGDCLLQDTDYGINAAAVRYREDLPVYLRITDITEDGRYSKKSIVSVNNIASASFFLVEGDLVFARTGASVGKTYLYNPEDGKLVFAGFLIRVKANPKVLLPEYLKYYTQTKYYWNWIRANSMRTGQPGINGNEYKELTVPLPPTKAEQTAIATALNDADKLITELEKLIAKKRNIKQGAMQELLRPKEGWEVKKLGEICSLSKSRFNPISSIGNYKCVELEHLSQETGRLLGYADSRDLRSQKSIFKKNDVLFGKLRPYLKKYFFAEFNGVCTTEIWVLISEKDIESKFLYYLVQTDKVIETANQSTGTKMPRAEWKTVSGTEVSLPTSKVEQNRIAQILSDMDIEIEALEKKLEKYKMLKQGMMQNLLTGKIRLVQPVYKEN